MVGGRFYLFLLGFVVFVLGYLNYQVLKPFISPLAWAMVLSIILYPLYARILKYVRLRSVASAVALLIMLIVIFGPFSYITYLFSQEMKSLTQGLEKGTFDPLGAIMGHPVVNGLLQKVLHIFRVSEEEFQKALLDAMSKAGRESMGLITVGIGNAAVTVVNFFLMVISAFFFLTDGPRFFENISGYLPFTEAQQKRLIKQIRGIVVSTIHGGVIVAIIQALIGGFSFWLLGISSPVIWGFSMFLSSFVPVLGTFMVWGPVAGYLAFQGTYLKAVILVLIGVAAISSVDNIVRPLIIRGRLQMPMLLIFLSILGGIKFFGFIGFIMGPLVVALFISVLDMLRYIEENDSPVKSE
jgi:predicted PurR-regulated permease PerM